MNALQDRFAVVTGASSGIGQAIALALAAQGARVCLLGRDADRLQAVAQQAGNAASWFALDLADDEALERLGQQLTADAGAGSGIDVLVHAAGALWFGAIQHSPHGHFDDHLRINVRAPYRLTQLLLPALIARQGQVVFVNSNSALQAKAGEAAYAASKHALKGLADSLREEVNASGVRVLSLYVGRTATPLQATLHQQEGKAYHPEWLMQPEDVAAVTLNALTLPRTVEVTDIRMRPMRKYPG